MTGAYGATRLLASLLFGITAKDPLPFAAVAGLLAFVALLACYLLATKVDRWKRLDTSEEIGDRQSTMSWS